MTINSYGWVILLIICIGLVGWVGSEAGYTVNGLPVDSDPLTFILNLSFGQIDNMPSLFTFMFDSIPFFTAWIIYRQARGQD